MNATVGSIGPYEVIFDFRRCFHGPVRGRLDLRREGVVPVVQPPNPHDPGETRDYLSSTLVSICHANRRNLMKVHDYRV